MSQPISSAAVYALTSDIPLGVNEALEWFGADRTDRNVKKIRNAFSNLKASGRVTSHSPGRYIRSENDPPLRAAPKAKPARNGKAADDLFVKVGKATQTLFPKGVPYDRIIEVAKLQETMLEVLTR